jgi:hypothetical protein
VSSEVKKVTKKKAAFDAWWSGLPSNVREGADIVFAKRCFRAGQIVGARPAKIKYRFRAGRYLVSVWSTSLKDALGEAEIELDFRVAKSGKSRPAAGWRFIKVSDDA